MGDFYQKAFVTGGTGFIGRAVVRKLIARGYQVVALARSERGVAMLREMGATAAIGDVTDRESMREAMRGSDIVFHIAGVYDYSPEGLRRCDSVNVGGTRNVLELAHELNISRIIHTSTLAVFGDTRGALPDETYFAGGPFLSEYDRTKWLAHYNVAEGLIAQGAPIIIVMPGAVYGPGDSSWLAGVMRLFHRGLLPVLPGPETTLCYTYVDDVAEGHLLAAEKGRLGESYILAGPAVPLGEMVEFWAHLTGKRPPTTTIPARFARNLSPALGRAGSVVALPEAFSEEMVRLLGVSYVGRSDKARAELGWRPRPLQAGMLETLEWIAATDPADAGVREKRAARTILLAAVALFAFWWVGRNRRHRAQHQAA